MQLAQIYGKFFFKIYRLKQHVRSQNDSVYSWLQENIASGIVTDAMLPYLNERVEAECDTLYNNDWYKDGRQVMITPTHQIKDEFNSKLLCHLEGEEVHFPAKDTPSTRTPNLPDLSKCNEQQMNGLPTHLIIKRNCPIKVTKNINKKDSLVNGTFGWVCDMQEDIICVLEREYYRLL